MSIFTELDSKATQTTCLEPTYPPHPDPHHPFPPSHNPTPSWLLTFRNAAAAQLPAFGADRLTSLLSALGALPLYVEASPLPIGFGTPRWALPRAVSDPESWENFLSAAADAFVDDLLRSITAAESAASAASHGRASAEVNATAAAQQAQRALLIEFARALAASKKWVMVRMDTEWVASQECEERVAAFVGKHWGALLEELRCADTDVSGTFCSSGGRSSSRRTGDAAGAPAASAAAPWEERHDACSGPLLADGVGAAAVAERGERWLRRRRHQILAAYLVRAQLQNRLQPPEHQLERFFALSAYSSGITNDYSLEDLEAIVRTLMIIGDSPSELWLMRLVDVVMERREDMGQQQLRGFVEGLRCALDFAVSSSGLGSLGNGMWV